MSGARRLRVAFVGKGGSGKSTISGSFARLLARRGEPVLALDSDPLPGMPYALGIAINDGPIPDDVVVEGPEGGERWVLDPQIDVETVIERYAAVGPDGVKYLQFGNLWGPISTLQRAQHAWSQVVREVDPKRWHLVGDLPGGTRQAMFGWAKYANTVCVVVEPTTKSLHAAERLLNLSKATWAPEHLVIVANKVADSTEIGRIEERLGRPVATSLPLDAALADGDRSGRPPLDVVPDGMFALGVGALIDFVASLDYSDGMQVTP